VDGRLVSLRTMSRPKMEHGDGMYRLFFAPTAGLVSPKSQYPVRALGARLNRLGRRKTMKNRFTRLGSMSGPIFEPRR
jgi:hypothetical protein